MSIAEDFAAALSPWDLTGDLSTYGEAIGQMFKQVELFAADTDTTVGWQLLWDVDLAPAIALPWLAQVVGERLPVGLSEAASRTQIKATPNQFRGTLKATVLGVQGALTGTKRVWIRERFNGSTFDEDSIAIATYEHETPDQQAVLNALRRTVPADINVFYEMLAGATWGTLETPAKDWAELEAEFGPTWADVSGAEPEGEFHE